MEGITTFLWFDGNAEEAANFYVSVFPNSEINDVSRYGEVGPGQSGQVMTVAFTLNGRPFIALNGGPEHASFNLAVSFMINCESQEEVDYYWDALGKGGKEIQCGWLTDRFGLPWQIIPTALPELLSDPDRDKAQRAMKAMLEMTKIDINKLREAAKASA